MANSEKFCLRWNDFESNISVAFRELREEKDFFDVTLACDDSQIQAHKVILSACSPFFRNVLRRNPHQHPLLYLKGVKYKELLCVLNFMYQGEVNVAQEELNSFLAVAEDLRVKGLTQNNSSGESKPKTDPPKIPRPPPRDPPPREPVPPPKRPRPDPPPPVNTYQQEEDDDIQEVVPVKSEPGDATTISNVDTPVYSRPQTVTHHPSPDQQQVAPQHADGGQDGALALDDSYANESYEYGQYEDGGYDDGSGMIDPNTGMPIQGVGGTDGNRDLADFNDLVASKLQEKRDEFGKKSWSCIDCGFTRSGKWDVSRHIEQKHMGLSIQCTFCPATYTRRDKLKAHLKHKHGVE